MILLVASCVDYLSKRERYFKVFKTKVGVCETVLPSTKISTWRVIGKCSYDTESAVCSRATICSFTF